MSPSSQKATPWQSANDHGLECRVTGEDLTGLLASLLEEKVDCSIRVHGMSMAPFVRDGDMVRISPVNTGDLKVGDLAAVTPVDGATPLVHRVIGIKSTGESRELLIKGDRCVYNDGWISEDCVVGKVQSVIRDEKKVHWGIPGVLLALLSRVGVLSRFAVRAAMLLVFAGLCSVVQAQEVPGLLEEEPKRAPLVVLKQATIQGQVFFLSEDAEQKPAKEIDIRVNTAETKKKLYETKTDKEGKYLLPNFDIGRYQLVVGRLKLGLVVTTPEKAKERVRRASKKIIVFIPEALR
ncbi:hypothetical protein BVX97_04335 [bacterium E08(2017)]|nr:hypothetical protein BVX97_04335 [bacterium E08(2017)]